jgi:hypothetical protein
LGALGIFYEKLYIVYLGCICMVNYNKKGVMFLGVLFVVVGVMVLVLVVGQEEYSSIGEEDEQGVDVKAAGEALILSSEDEQALTGFPTGDFAIIEKNPENLKIWIESMDAEALGYLAKELNDQQKDKIGELFQGDANQEKYRGFIRKLVSDDFKISGKLKGKLNYEKDDGRTENPERLEVDIEGGTVTLPLDQLKNYDSMEMIDGGVRLKKGEAYVDVFPGQTLGKTTVSEDGEVNAIIEEAGVNGELFEYAFDLGKKGTVTRDGNKYVASADVVGSSIIKDGTLISQFDRSFEGVATPRLLTGPGSFEVLPDGGIVTENMYMVDNERGAVIGGVQEMFWGDYDTYESSDTYSGRQVLYKGNELWANTEDIVADLPKDRGFFFKPLDNDWKYTLQEFGTGVTGVAFSEDEKQGVFFNKGLYESRGREATSARPIKSKTPTVDTFTRGCGPNGCPPGAGGDSSAQGQDPNAQGQPSAVEKAVAALGEALKGIKPPAEKNPDSPAPDNQGSQSQFAGGATNPCNTDVSGVECGEGEDCANECPLGEIFLATGSAAGSLAGFGEAIG